MNTDITIDELETLKKLINSLDEKGDVFKRTTQIIKLNEKEKQKEKKLNIKEGDRKI